MSVERTTEVGYGFFQPGEGSQDLLVRFGLENSENHRIEGWPDTGVLKSLGYGGLSILQRSSNTDVGDWAICASASHRYLDEHESGTFPLLSVHQADVNELIRLRDRLYPDIETQPRIGWFLISSVW